MLKQNRGETFGIEGMRGRWDAKHKPRDYGIHGLVDRDYVIEECYCGPSNFTFH